MEQKFDIGLNSKINEFTKRFGIIRTDTNDENIFEDFSNYVIASNLLEEELENIKSVSTNNVQGIDGIVIIVNDILISDEGDLNKIGPTEQIKIKIGFIQSTTLKSFDEQKFSAFTDAVVKFMVGEFEIEPFTTVYKKLLNEADDFIDRIVETPRISLFFVSARTSHQIETKKIKAESNKITNRNEIGNKCELDKIAIYQKDEIKSEYEKISKFHYVQLHFDNCVQLSPTREVELSLLATIKFSELKKLILTSTGMLKEKLFVENVRNYIGNTPVNTDIKKLLIMRMIEHIFLS